MARAGGALTKVPSLIEEGQTTVEKSGQLMFAEDFDDKAVPLKVTGPENDRLKIQTEKEHQLKQVVTQQKITNKLLSETFEIEVTERDVK